MDELREYGEEITNALPESVRSVMVAQARVRMNVGTPRDVQIVKAAAERCKANRFN